MNRIGKEVPTSRGATPQAPRVVSLILVWNEVADTVKCVESLLASRYPNQHILLVDNGSREGIVADLRSAFPSVEILELGSNLGFSAGNNAGIAHALRHGFEYIFLLNQDTIVEPEALGRLVGFAESNADTGIVGPSVLCCPDDSLLYAAGGTIEWSTGSTCNEGMFELAASSPYLEAPRPVDFVPGCGMLVSRRFIETAGDLDPDYFFNFEEVEWAVRGSGYGFKFWCVPGARMWHKVSASLGTSSPANTYYMTRNALRFFWANSSGFKRWSAVPLILLRTCRTIAAWSIKPAYRSDDYRRRTLANLMAIRDFVFGRYGKMNSDVARVCRLVH